MRFDSCSMEREVMTAVRTGQWPAACDAALAAHVERCSSCRRLVSLSLAFRDSRGDAASKATFGTPGLLFWKAQLRRRNEAVEKITRPIMAAEIVGLAVTVFVLALVAWKWLYTGASASAQAVAFSSAVSEWGGLLVAAVVVTIALFGGVAFYLATSRE